MFNLIVIKWCKPHFLMQIYKTFFLQGHYFLDIQYVTWNDEIFWLGFIQRHNLICLWFHTKLNFWFWREKKNLEVLRKPSPSPQLINALRYIKKLFISCINVLKYQSSHHSQHSLVIIFELILIRAYSAKQGLPVDFFEYSNTKNLQFVIKNKAKLS